MKSGWEEIWKEHKQLNWFGRRLKDSQENALKKILEKIKLPKDSRIIDVGCGTCWTLNFFRELEYDYSIGVDY